MNGRLTHINSIRPDGAREPGTRTLAVGAVPLGTKVHTCAVKIPTQPRIAAAWRWAALAALTFVAACARSPEPAPRALPPGEWRAFEGTWTAAGTRRVLAMGRDRRSSTFHLTGSLLLQGEKRLGVGFRAEVIGFSDSANGMQGRSVWTDERGNEVYSELKGEAVGPGGLIDGTIVGGTGLYAGATGDYSFHWQYVFDSGGGEASVRVVDLRGRVRTP
jgi:hypothetical protein